MDGSGVAEVESCGKGGDTPDDLALLSDFEDFEGFNEPLPLDEQGDFDDAMLETQDAIAWFNANLPAPTPQGKTWKEKQASPSYV